MRRYNIWNRLTAASVALVLLLTLCPAAAAAERTLTVTTAEQLEELAKKCASDTYSKDLTVLLGQDIDLGGKAVSIPIFLGTFDGQGHRISGLSLTGNDSQIGLFSQIESGATVKNLAVSGEVTPGGNQSCVGGIAGVNRGSIADCRFSGVVIGNDSVGGIAGLNDAGGTISGSAVTGAVRGTQSTGGVAGENAGTLLRCTSSAAVNTTVTEEDMVGTEELESLESQLYSLLKQEKVTGGTGTNDITDTGGIVGYSTGVVQSCVNSGTVGYPHVGYNTGGIAGRQNGYMASCVNHGTVQGRKDIGGVVGQMAPDVTLQLSNGSLEELRQELETLQSQIDKTLDDAQAASDTVSGRIDRISDYADSARDSAKSLSDALSDFADDNISEINDLTLLIERYLDKGTPILDDLRDASGDLETVLTELRTLIGKLDQAENIGTMLQQLQTFCQEMENAGTNLKNGMNALKEAFRLMGEANPDLPDTSQLDSDLGELMKALVACNESIAKAIQEYNDTGSVTPETQAQLKENLEAAFTCYSAVVKDLNDILENTDFGQLRQDTLEQMKNIAQQLQIAAEEFGYAAGHMNAAMEAMKQALAAAGKINDEADGIRNQADLVLSAALTATKDLTAALKKAAQWAKDLADEDPVHFSQLGKDYTDNADTLNAALSGISNELQSLNSELSDSSTRLLNDAKAINSQFMKVMNLFLDLLEGVSDTSTDLIEDVSEESLKSAVKGKVLECKNYGAVSADRNAGGIAGSMAIEYDLDPEDDLTSDENRFARYTYQTKAILMDCGNYGTVEVKKSCAGGIVGRMDLGVVFGCGGYGEISGDGSDYVGGVSGLALSAIRSSYAKCTLSGGRYVGGIAGSGSRIFDCVSMVEITESTQQDGAVAGEVTDEYSGNRFVSDDLAGVDRMSLAGKAEQISYEELRAIAGIPDEFLRMTLSFVAEDKTLKTLPFDYGDSFDADIYPKAPEKEGYYLHWDHEDLQQLHFDTKVTAVYEPYVTTLASEEKREGHPLVLVQGQFRTEDAISAAQTDAPQAVQGQVLETWQVEIPEDDAAEHSVRWLTPENGSGHYTAYVDEGDGWKTVSSELIGSYLCFTMTGSGSFAVVSSAGIPVWVWIAMAVVVLLAILLILGKKRKKKAGGTPNSAKKELAAAEKP